MTFTKTLYLGAALLAVIFFLFGGGRYAAAQGTVEDSLTDPQISDAVNRKLKRDQALPADRIRVATVSGIVTLSGSVPSILARERATALAETVKGVTGVVNRIAVTTPDRPDAELAADVERALRAEPATAARSIDAAAADGTVTLTGAVGSWQEQALAARVAKGVRGVRAIDSNIMVADAADRSDADIRRDIASALRWYAYVDASRIDVAVEDGRVSLSGAVGSMAEKSLAQSVAWVAGVTAVDAGALEIDWRARGQRPEGPSTPPTATEIATAVAAALAADPRVDASRVTVTVEDDIAILSGTVENVKARRAAALNAANVAGVGGVNNRIAVAPDTPPGDDWIEARVQEALMRDPYVDRFALTVTVEDGAVFLEGEVDTQFEKALADDLAARQAGVVEVFNDIVVAAPGAADYNPYADEWNVRAYEWYDAPQAGPVPLSDWELARNVRQELFWSPFVDADDIEVSVTNGVARLTGRVRSWSERDAAARSAREAGARAVDNDLAISRTLDFDQF